MWTHCVLDWKVKQANNCLHAQMRSHWVKTGLLLHVWNRNSAFENAYLSLLMPGKNDWISWNLNFLRNLPSEKKYLSTRDTWIKIIFKKQWNLRKQCIYFQIIPRSIHMFHLIWLASVFRNVTCLHLFYSRTFIPNTHKFHFKSTNSGLQSSLFYFRIAMSCTIFSGGFFFFLP